MWAATWDLTSDLMKKTCDLTWDLPVRLDTCHRPDITDLSASLVFYHDVFLLDCCTWIQSVILCRCEYLLVSGTNDANITGRISLVTILNPTYHFGSFTSEACQFLCTDISQGSVAMWLRIVEIFNDQFTTNAPQSLQVKGFCKSVNI